MFNGIKKAVKKMRDTKKAEAEKTSRLTKWKDKLEIARTNWDNTAIDERELIYNGTHDVDEDINTSKKSGYISQNVVNVVYEFLEAMIDTTIPEPVVKSKRREFSKLATMIEDSAKNDLEEIGIERINDETERTTPIQGYSILRVDWDPDYKHHLYRGEIKVSTLHPKQFIPQPGVYDLQDMDYFFLLYSATKNYVKRRYGVDVSNEAEEYPDNNQFHDGQNTTNSDERVTVIVVFYRDDDADVGKYTWCNEVELEDLPKFYYRRLERCTICGALKGNAEECANVLDIEGEAIVCGNSKYRKSIEETELIDHDVILSDGRMIPAGTEIPYFQPTKYPVIIRRNVPVAFQLGGQSDVDLIRDQQDAIKKIVHSIAEKIIRGGSIIKALDDHRIKLTGELYQIVKGSQAQLNALTTMDFTANVINELQVAQFMYKSAQDVLGVTNSWMGKEDTTAKSGVAKQIQVQQSGGRLESKKFNKYTAFKELFEMMFEFKLAYYDELRPYLRKAENNQEDWGDFNKYEFLSQDMNGEWYYNTDFLFSSSAGDGFPKERLWVEQEAREMFKEGAIDKVGLWTILESINYPMANEMKENALREQQMAMSAQGNPSLANPQNKQVQVDAFLQSLPPEIIQFMQQTMQPQEMLAHLQQMIQMPPDMLQQHLAEMMGSQI